MWNRSAERHCTYGMNRCGLTLIDRLVVWRAPIILAYAVFSGGVEVSDRCVIRCDNTAI
jgi:hypothetical protein